jgi:hypothetical protein
MATPFSCLKSHPLGEDRAAFDELVKEAISTNGATTAEQKLAANIEVAELMLADISKERAEVMAQIDLQIQEARQKYGRAPTQKNLDALEKLQQSILSTNTNDDYRGQHKASGFEDGAPASDVSSNGIYPSDFYSNNALRYYGGASDYDAQAIRKIHSLKGKPNSKITIYRAVPSSLDSESRIKQIELEKNYILKKGKVPPNVNTKLDRSTYYDKISDELDLLISSPQVKAEINDGDWVTITKGYAKDHGESALNGDYIILQKTVKASEIFTNGDSIQEWGYSPKESKLSSERKEVIDTPEFKKWFGDSKVVDADGKPLIVYHGTDKEFYKFDTKKATQGVIWFANSREDIDSGNIGAQGSGRVMELYVSIKNPAGWKQYDQLGIDELSGRGYDGVILEEKDGSFVGFAFNSTQFKDANNNNGKFDASNPDIRKSSARNSIPLYEENKSITETLQTVAKNPKLASEVAKNLLSTGSAQNKTVETLVTNLFDSDNTLEQIARRTGKSKEAKAFLDTQKSYKAAGEKVIADTLEEYYEPMQATLQDAWRNTFSDMAWYKETGYKQFLNDLSTVGNLVMHGKERNADIARKTQGKDLAGSGRTNAEIDQIEKDINKEAAGLIDLYKKIYVENLKPMIDIANNAKKTSGLITPEMEAGRQNYQWYVPLYGDPSEFNTMAVGGADKLSSNKDKGAMGREGTLADNVLQNVLVQMSTSVKKASMQNMKRDFVAWVKSSKDVRDEMGAKVNSPESTEIFEKYKGADGLVHERVKNSALSPNVFVYKNGTETTTIEIKNPEVITSLNGLSPVEGLLGGVQKATRLMSAVFTRYNPIFPVMNKLRDSQSQISFILADAPVENVTEVARKTLANNLKYTRQWNKKSDEYAKWTEMYETLGGKSTYSDVLNDKVMKNLEREFAVAVDSKFTIQKYANKVSKLVDAVNDHMEMSSRVALFQALVETGGMNEKDAMLYTKNTMNFETKGKWGQQLAAIYAFASPALFDARRMGQALRTPRGAMVMGAHFALMYGLYAALKSMGGDDEDGVARLNKTSVNQSGRFLTFITEDGTGYKIPVGFGFGRIALTLAASTHRYMDGVDDIGEFSQHVAIDGLLSNFSAIEPKNISIKNDAMGWAMQTFLPTVAQPMYQVAANQNFQGAPIHKPDEWTGSKLRFTQSWPNTPQLYKDAAALMYETTGLDVYPETMSHLLRSYGGNGVVDVTRAFMLAGEKSEKEWTLADIPAIQGFSNRQSSQDSNRFRANFENSLKLEDQRKYAMKNGTLEEFDTEHPDFRKTMSVYKSANKVIKDLYTRRKAVQGTEEAKEINKQIRAIQARANQEAEI